MYCLSLKCSSVVDVVCSKYLYITTLIYIWSLDMAYYYTTTPLRLLHLEPLLTKAMRFSPFRNSTTAVGGIAA
jgi:hypothetical protein